MINFLYIYICNYTFYIIKNDLFYYLKKFMITKAKFNNTYLLHFIKIYIQLNTILKY